MGEAVRAEDWGKAGGHETGEQDHMSWNVETTQKP